MSLSLFEGFKNVTFALARMEIDHVYGYEARVILINQADAR